ncbi:MAG: hypothetical protein V1870_05300 [Candidatus Aenigmatarchaeota archaeon]
MSEMMTRREFFEKSAKLFGGIVLGVSLLGLSGCNGYRNKQISEKYITETDKELLKKTADELSKYYREVEAFEIIRPAEDYLLGPYVYGFDGEQVHVYSKSGKYLFRMYGNDGKTTIQIFSDNGNEESRLVKGYDTDWRKLSMKEVNTQHKTTDGDAISVTTNGVLEPYDRFIRTEHEKLVKKRK